MHLVEYRKQILRTLPDLGTEALNMCHMMLGMTSEIEELEHAVRIKDLVGVGEELADWCWYAGNYANLRDIPVVIQTDVGSYDTRNLYTITSRMSNLIKQFIAYGEMKQPAQEVILLQTGFNIVFNFYDNGISPNIEEAFDKNIAKLRARYPAKFDKNLALNRDLDKERKALEE